MIFTPADQSTWESPSPCEYGLVLLETAWAQLFVGELLGRTPTGAYVYRVVIRDRTASPSGKAC
jgi:hypothetical protein